MTAAISIVMVTWRSGDELVQAVEAALAAPATLELVLVNHGNGAKTTAALRAAAAANPKLKLVETGANLGFAKGSNIGARAADGELLLFLNPDTAPTGQALARLAQTAEKLNGPFVIGARLLNRDGSEQRGARRGALTPWTALVGFLGLHRLRTRFGDAFRDIHREHEPAPEKAIDTDVVSGAAMLIRRDVFLDLGGFDEGYFLHVEDIDICRRVKQAGGRVVFEPRAEIMHYGSMSRTSLFFVESCKAAGFVRYFWKFYPSPAARVLTALAAPLIFMAFMARAAFIRTRGTLDHLRHRLRVRRRLARIRKNGP
ncbi:MAG: glycosyltransferase family 2 protein [Maricaulaceae bacterium]|nr:glycosyltransferase family 2 protein [Maricaulaceae bacterium]